ncbi:MAG TPA: hypothetical protein DEH09_13290, partial [Alcanivorax sp.]|nr:hypothetical protein [Alcanivorax sp.]HBY50231.1 hypothetical protein [Alcanivorax sp.]
RLWLRVPQLDALSNDGDVLDALKSLALSSPRADLRVLFDDAGHAVKTGHGLIHLGRRLPSRLQLRQTQADDADPRLCFAVADRTGLFEAHGWPRPERLTLCAHALPLGPRRADEFAHVWERGRANRELRELRL